MIPCGNGVREGNLLFLLISTSCSIPTFRIVFSEADFLLRCWDWRSRVSWYWLLPLLLEIGFEVDG